MQTVITAATDAEAQEKYRDLAQYADIEGALALMSGWMGTDLSKQDRAAPIGHIESNPIQSAAETFRKASGDGEEWTVRRLAEWVGVGGFGPILIGSGETVAEGLINIQDETDVDGFNLAYHITPGTFEDVVEYVVPELQKCGRYKT